MGLTQSKISNAGSVTSLAISFNSLPAVGSRVVVAVSVWPQGEGDNLTCTDNQSHTYTARWGVVSTGNLNSYACFDVVVANSSGTFTITVGGMGNSGDLSVAILELSGAGSFEEVVYDASSSSSSNPSKSITTDGADREVVGVMTHDWANNPADVTEGGGFTLVQEQTNNNSAAALYVARKAVASAGTESLSYTFNDAGSHIAVIGLLAYYGSSGPGPSSDSIAATDSASLAVTISSSDSAAETDASSAPGEFKNGSDTAAATDIARLHAQTASRAYVVTQAVASGSTGPVVITAPAANEGDLLLIHVHQRTNNATLSISGAGGQSWTSGTKRTQGTTNTSQTFWAIKTGTLTNVTVAGTTTASESMIARMVVIRGNHADIQAILDLAESGAGFAAPSTPFDVTATGQTTVSPGALALAFFGSQDDNQWQVQTSGWTGVAAVTQNTGGTDNSEYGVHKEMPTPGATGNVTARQNTVGGDAGTQHVISIRPAQIALDVVTAWDEASLSIQSGSSVDTSDTAAATDAGSQAAAATGTDSAAASDASMVNREQTSSDSAAFTDAGNNIAAAASSSDTAAATDAGSQPEVAVPGVDTAAASDAATIARDDTAAETASAGDASSVAAAVAVTDAISAAEAGALDAAVAAADSAGGAIDASAVSVAMQGAETATAADSAALDVGITATDASAADDESTADQGGPTSVSSSDTAAATDSASVTAATIDASDSATFSETSTTGTPLASSDTAAATDAGMVDKSLLAADAAATTEAGVQLDIAAEAPYDEANTTDAGAPAAAMTGEDTAAASEAGSIVSSLAAADTAAATDAGSLAAAAAGSDSGAAADASNADKGSATLFSDNFNSGNTSAWTGELVSGSGSLVEVVAGSANEGGYGLRSYKPNGANNGAAGVYKTGITSTTGIWSARFKVRINSVSYGGGLWLITVEHPTNGRTFNIHHFDDGNGWRMNVRHKDGTEANIFIGSLSTGVWYDVEAIYSEAGAQPVASLYLDGVLVGTNTDASSGGNALTPSQLYLRPFEQSWTNSWDMSFDQVVVADGLQQTNTNASKDASDSGAAADSATIARQDASSDAAEATEAASLAVALADADSGASSDASAEPTTTGEEFTTADSAAAEDASSPEVAFASSDTATASDAASLAVQITANDDPDAEDASAVSVAVASADSAAAAEASAFGTPVIDFDAGFVSEAASLAVALSSTDAGSATETSAVPTFVAGSDTAAATESASLIVNLFGTDFVVTTDASAPAAALAGADTAAASDASSPAVALLGADAGSASDAAVLAALMFSSDVAAAVDAAAPGAALVALALAADSAAAADVTLDLFQGASGYDHKLVALVLPAARFTDRVLPAAVLVALVLPAASLAVSVVNADDVEA